MILGIVLQLSANFGVPTYDSKSWMGFEFNQTTRTEILSKWATIRRENGDAALHIQTDGSAIVDCLMADDRESAKLRAIRIELRGTRSTGLLPSSTPHVLYAIHRYENWCLWTWPERGVAAVILDWKLIEVLLTTPDRMPLLNAGFAVRRTKISETPYISNLGKKPSGLTGDGWSDSVSAAKQRFTSAEWRKMLPPRRKESCDDNEYRLIVNAYAARESPGFYASPAAFRWSQMEEVYENLVIPISPDR